MERLARGEKRKPRRVAKELRACATCGEPLPLTLREGAIYCGLACMQRASRTRGFKTAAAIECECCGQEFSPDKLSRRFCSQMCSINARRRRQHIACAQCSTVFYPPTHTALFCSLSCAAKAKHAAGVLRHFPLKLTARRADQMFERMRPKRRYRRRLSAARFDAMFIVQGR